MVLADRGGGHEDASARNGRRSRGGSPSNNGHAAQGGSDSTSSDEEREGDGGMRVGRDYQAVIPECIPAPDRRPEQCPERALLVWSPTADLPDSKRELDEYISLAKEKYGYNAEQALGMLFWHKHDLEKAILDLANFTPFPDEWTVEDKVLFEQAFQFHGKSFHRIRQMLPDKSIASLVKYYYSWKKTRTRTSLMDRQARRLAQQRGEDGSDGGSEQGSNSDSEGDDKQEGKRTINRGIRRESGLSSYVTSSEEKDHEGSRSVCANCGVFCTHLHATPKGNMCSTCSHYWKRNGSLRPTTGPIKREGAPAGGASSSGSGGTGAATSSQSRHHHPHHHHHHHHHHPHHLLVMRHKRKPPRGMYINHDDLVAMATGPSGQGDGMLKAMDREIVSLKRQVQNNKQMISSLKRITGEGVEEFRVDGGTGRVNARWTNDELLLAVQGVRKYGKDFKAIAEVIGTKTEAHLRSFFVNYRRRYNLDAVLKEYEVENGPIANDDEKETKGEAKGESKSDAKIEAKEEKMEVDASSGSDIGTPTPPGANSPITVGVSGPGMAPGVKQGLAGRAIAAQGGK